MSIFSMSAMCAIGLAPIAAGWIEQNSELQWRWIQWISLMFVPTFNLQLALMC